MRIVIFPAPSNQEISGVGTHVRMLATGLEFLQNEVFVIDKNPPEWFRIPFIRIPEILFAKMNLYYSRRFRRCVEDLYYTFVALWKTKGAIDVINVQNVQQAGISRIIQKWTRCRLLLTVHGYMTYEAEASHWCEVGDRTHRWLWGMETSGYEKPDAIICVASKTKKYVETYSTKTIHLIHNGIDTNLFFPPEAGVKQTGAGVTILFSGLLQQAKGIMEALEVVRRIVKQGNRVVFFRIAGNGQQADEALQYVKRHGLEDYVEFLGALNKDQMPDFYRSGEILLFTSKQAGLSGCAEESLPYSVVEAMASGVSVIAFGTGGLGELVLDGVTGYLCEPGDIGQVVVSVEKLLDEPQKRQTFSENSRNYCIKKFSHVNMAREYLAVYAAES